MYTVVNFSSLYFCYFTGSDYTAISSVAAVFERSAFTTIRIPIINDDRAEVTESFSVMLTSTSSAVSITQPDAVVQITDSDGKANCFDWMNVRYR